MAGNQPKFQVRALAADDLALIAQVDRSEVNAAEYLALPSDDGLALRLTRTPIDPPARIGPWTDADVKARIGWWMPEVQAGGLLLGAMDAARMCGFGVLGPVKKDRSVELHALFVDSRCRRRGIGGALLDELERLAAARGAVSIWCGSNRTASAVEFYLKHGYRPLGLHSNALVRHRSGDPVLAKSLHNVHGIEAIEQG